MNNFGLQPNFILIPMHRNKRIFSRTQIFSKRKLSKEQLECDCEWGYIGENRVCLPQVRRVGGGKAKEMNKKIKNCRWLMRKFRSRRDRIGVQRYNEARGSSWNYCSVKRSIGSSDQSNSGLKEGDQNTRFFHNFAMGRRKNNQVTRLKDKNGKWVDTITEYFTELFQSSTRGGVLSDKEQVTCITEEENTQLIAPIMNNEVKEAVFSMHAEKAPGYDGLNPCFYQTYWGVVGEDVVKFCQNFFNTGELQVEINRTVVCLIPKVKNPQ